MSKNTKNIISIDEAYIKPEDKVLDPDKMWVCIKSWSFSL